MIFILHKSGVFFCKKNIKQIFVKVLQFVKSYNIMPIIKKGDDEYESTRKKRNI